MKTIFLSLALATVPGLLFGDVPRVADGAAGLDRARMERQRQQAEQDYQEALLHSEEDGDYSMAARLYLKAAEAGYAPAQYSLADLYDKGLGVECSPQQAARWYRRAAEQGDPEAQNNLGSLYSQGRGVPRNPVEAVRWFTLAAAQSNPEATSNLGIMYLKGRGVECDPVHAFQLFRQAAERGYAAAQNNLALMYANGQAVSRDYIRAYAWLDIAAETLPASADLRDRVGREMTAEELSRARDLAATKRAQLRLRAATNSLE